MITVDGIEYRNLEEQVQFLSEIYNKFDDTYASKNVVNNISSVLNDQQSQITQTNQQLQQTNEQVKTVNSKFLNYVPIQGTQTIDAKIFKVEIALQSAEGEVTRLKNLNNNITLTNGNGVNLLNIDEQLQKIQAFGKTLATLDDIASGEGTKVTVGGVVQDTFNADTKADASTVNQINTQVSANTIAISGLAQNKADKTSIPSVVGLASETYVNQQISSEATERINADTNLQNQIDSEESTRQSQFTALESGLNSEVSTRINADTNLQNQISTLDARDYILSQSTNYTKWKNGFMICYGKIEPSTSEQTRSFNFPQPFSDVPCVFKCFESTSTRTGTVFKNNSVESVTTTSFSAYTPDNGVLGYTKVFWMAVGRWK